MLDIDGLITHYPVSRRTVNRWVAKGCPSRLIYGRRLFYLSKVEKWLIQFNQGNWMD